jgi:uncharacterized phage-associated protein
MANVFDVAKYFQMLAASGAEDAGESMTHLKLQKLLYYSQGFHLALSGGRPLFDDPILAWKHGPVVNIVWKEYKAYGSGPIPAIEGFDPAKCLSEDERSLLNDVWNAYGQFSAWKLRNMTHEEPPWRLAWETGIENEHISPQSMAAYFVTQLTS